MNSEGLSAVEEESNKSPISLFSFIHRNCNIISFTIFVTGFLKRFDTLTCFTGRLTGKTMSTEDLAQQTVSVC